MRTLILAAALVFCSASQAQRSVPSEASPETRTSNTYYYGVPDRAITLRIESRLGLTSVLNVPQGVNVNVEAIRTQSEGLEQAGQHVYAGNVVIRLLRQDEVPAEEGEAYAMRDVMASSPVKMELMDVVVYVSEVQKEGVESAGER